MKWHLPVAFFGHIFAIFKHRLAFLGSKTVLWLARSKKRRPKFQRLKFSVTTPKFEHSSDGVVGHLGFSLAYPSLR